ncbi:MAG: hypothetical protein MK179_05385 [Pirellulaceae bacterium]|nr:hypothetical protein [Pirellulaceae bacterium]
MGRTIDDWLFDRDSRVAVGGLWSEESDMSLLSDASHMTAVGVDDWRAAFGLHTEGWERELYQKQLLTS